MKTSILRSAIVTLILAAGQACPAAEPPATPVKELMQSKLRDAQSLVGSVVTADFTAMEKSARHLVELGLLSSWLSSQTPAEQIALDGFRRNADAIVKAAQKKDINAATLAYVQLTLSCVDCHKHARDARTAAVPPLGLGALARSR